MALAKRALEPPPFESTAGLPCSIGALYDKLDGQPKEIAGLDRMLYQNGWNAGQVWEALRDEGFIVGKQSVNRHRGRKCRCFRDAA